MPRWAWPRLFSVLWLVLTMCEWSSYSIPHQCPIPPWSLYPLRTLFSPMMATLLYAGELWWPRCTQKSHLEAFTHWRLSSHPMMATPLYVGELWQPQWTQKSHLEAITHWRLFSPYDGYFPLCWRAVVARTTEFRNREQRCMHPVLAFFCQASDTWLTQQPCQVFWLW